MSYICWIDIENLFSWRSCASWFDIHRNDCASNKKNIRQHDYRLRWADQTRWFSDVTPVSCASTHHALASLRNRLCLTHAPRGDMNVSEFFLSLYGLDCRCQCHVFFASEVLCHRSLSLNLKHLVSHHSKGLSKAPFHPRFCFGFATGIFLGCSGLCRQSFE